MYFHAQNGRTISDSFFFAPQLESIGKWYRQLMAESIGKENDLQGNIVHAGITPTVSVGSTDLHSVGQLYLSGPRDKTTTFIYTTNEPAMVAVPSTLQFPLVEGIENKKLRDIMKAILEGVKIAYKKQELPFMEVALETITEQSLGEFLQLKMIEIMYLGKLFNINTFDQPHVELYKVETKRILNG
jgi:glucose-6-phosphate isomerase